MTSISDADPVNSNGSRADWKLTLCDLLKSTNEEGLAHVPLEVLQQCVKPILEGLQRLDAELLLKLDRVADGAVLHKGVNVRPIHSQIKPSCTDEAVRYLHLGALPAQYSMGIFIFPPHSKIPLHDHPGMCVLSRVLYGSLRRVSMDLSGAAKEEAVTKQNFKKRENVEFLDSSWKSWRGFKSDGPNLPKKGKIRAYKKRVDHLEAPNCTALYPTEGNLHEFVAGPDGAAVLDVLFPPYENHDRKCTFYHIVADCVEPGDYLNQQQSWWLEPIDQPEDYHCISGRYQMIGDID